MLHVKLESTALTLPYDTLFTPPPRLLGVITGAFANFAFVVDGWTLVSPNALQVVLIRPPGVPPILRKLARCRLTAPRLPVR